MHNNDNPSPLPRPRLRRRWITTIGAGLCVLALGAAAGCSSSSSSASTASQARAASNGSAFPGGTSLQGKTVLMVIYSQPLAAWTPALNGAKAVEASTGLKVDVEYANNNDQTEISEIEAGVSRNVAGMALQIDDTAVAHAVCSAAQKGIPVIAWNNDALTGSSASCVQAYVGQNEAAAGVVIGQYIVQHGYVSPERTSSARSKPRRRPTPPGGRKESIRRWQPSEPNVTWWEWAPRTPGRCRR